MQRTSLVRAGQIIGKWIPALLLVAIFLPQGWAKFSDTSGWAVAVRHWGYPDWFRIGIGGIELAGAGLLLWGRSAGLGAILILAVMFGAWATHLMFDQGRHMTSEIVAIVLATIVVIVRRKELAGLMPRRH